MHDLLCRIFAAVCCRLLSSSPQPLVCLSARVKPKYNRNAADKKQFNGVIFFFITSRADVQTKFNVSFMFPFPFYCTIFLSARSLQCDTIDSFSITHCTAVLSGRITGLAPPSVRLSVCSSRTGSLLED